MTTTIDIMLAEQDLGALLDLAKAGNEVVITQGDVPIARLVGVPSQPPQQPRRAGMHPGAITVSEDFDEALPNEFWTGTP